MTLYILKINKYFSYFHSFLLTSAFITDNFLIMADDVRCPDVTSSWRIFTKLSEYVYLTKIKNLCKFCVNPIIFQENTAINVPKQAEIWEKCENRRVTITLSKMIALTWKLDRIEISLMLTDSDILMKIWDTDVT